MNRRTFLGSLAVGSGLCSARLANAAAEGPRLSFPHEPRARLAVASYPFRKDYDPRRGTLKLLDFPQMVVARFNVRGIEAADEHFLSTEQAYLAEFNQALSKAGAHVVNIPVGVLHGSFADPDENKRRVVIANAVKWVDVAAALNCPSIRVHIQGVKGAAPDVALASQSLKAVSEYGKQKNVVVNLENDDPNSEDAFFIVSILQKVNSPWLRALPDFCNSMLAKKGEAFNDQALRALFPLASTISHAKEIESDGPAVYKINVGNAFKIARESGYKGYFSMEWDSNGDPYEGTKHLIEASLQSLA